MIDLPSKSWRLKYLHVSHGLDMEHLVEEVETWFTQRY